jgi:hypothetical protein
MSTPRRISDTVKAAARSDVPSDEEFAAAKRAQAEALERLRSEMPDVALEVDSRRAGHGRGYTPLVISSTEERHRLELELTQLDERRLGRLAVGRRRSQIRAALRAWDETIVELIPAPQGLSIYNWGDRYAVFAFARLRDGSVTPMTWEDNRGEEGYASRGTLAPYQMLARFAANRRLEREVDGEHMLVNFEGAN